MAGCTFLGAKKPPTPTHPQRAPPFCNNFGILEIEITNLKDGGAWLRHSRLHQRAEFEIQERRADMETPAAEGMSMRMRCSGSYGQRADGLSGDSSSSTSRFRHW
ncbi:hypothetical protein CKAH01_12932 [Colletotrichum kahawae]|uniref:Uncharacterized protein n=1 Tax=Colletotrichum kahawae TaxID=34407 RepID=A0AAD9YS10_COLKA|nr:hypothetical protein CKAH01_12932 [Colletotrichum kahawae]